MAEHSTLTGASLHEPKGIASAAANRVYVSNGVGSGSWSQVPASALVSTIRAFEGQLLHYQHLVASGTDGGTLTGATWNKRTLNQSVTNEITGATVTSSVISLPAGTYYVEASASSGPCGTTRLRLRNTTDGSTLLTGLSARMVGTAAGVDGVNLHLGGRFTLAGTKNIELQQWPDSTRNTDGMGLAVSTGESEIYANIMIWKVA